MKSPVQDESTFDLPVPITPFVSRDQESEVEQGSNRMQQKPARKFNQFFIVKWRRFLVFGLPITEANCALIQFYRFVICYFVTGKSIKEMVSNVL